MARRARSNRGSASNLKRYWSTGEGGKTKARWGTPGAFRRCVKATRKYLGPRAEGFCANRAKQATGRWPGQKRR